MSVCYYPLVFNGSANKCIGANFNPRYIKIIGMSGGNDELYYDPYRIGLT